MNTPIGGTVIQLVPDIQDQNNDELEQEAEEQEDRLRRHNEIACALDRFLELDGEYDESIEHNNFRDTSFRCNETNGSKQVLNSSPVEPIHLRLEARNHEISQSNEMQLKRKIDDIQKQLDLAIAERDRALLTRNQTHELLIESKAKVTEFESRENNLKEMLEVAHSENKTLRLELQQARTFVSDLQYKVHLLENDVDQRQQILDNKSLKEMRERYNAQINLLQQQIDCLTNKIEKKVMID